ncbi:LtfC-like domain-containing protein [Nocardia asiatica]|uniref:LtfC-like domain-containing protein n=1 Tax=Nocardia asiatica TaxID=209252 RepID=UPI00245374EF|nr:hypothetical protein [Nocardia asiatica]
MAIGHQPIAETLFLVAGQDFVHDIYPLPGEEIPPETSAEIVFYDPAGTVVGTWAALVSSSSISWNVSYALADTISIPAYFRIYVHYSDGKDFCWYSGTVARKG